MTDLETYARPWPPMTDQAPDSGPCCKAKRQTWFCTRNAGHDGRHEAGNPGRRMFASWPADVQPGGAR